MDRKKLHTIVAYYVKNNTAEIVGEESDVIKASLTEKLYDDVKEEILKSEMETQKIKVRKLIEEERKKHTILDMKNLLWEGFFLAFLVGLLVNQITSVMDIFKGIPVVNMLITLIIILILLALTILLYNFKYTKDIVKKITEKNNQASDDER